MYVFVVQPLTLEDVSEMAPPEKRGALGVLFQLTVTLGIFFSFLVGWGIASLSDGMKLDMLRLTISYFKWLL
jgi:hypothetical protein